MANWMEVGLLPYINNLTYRLLLISVVSLPLVPSLSYAVPVAAYEFRVDSLSIKRSLSSTDPLTTYFSDSFDDGSSPPSAPNLSDGTPITYGMFGSMGPENEGGNGKLVMNSFGTELSPVTGDPTKFSAIQKAQLRTNIGPNTNPSGLKDNQRFRVDAVFDLMEPDSDGEMYGLRLEDPNSITGSLGNDVLVLRVVQLSSRDFVNFSRFDRINNIVTSFASVELTSIDFDTYDQILLSFDKVLTSSNDITASFNFMSGGSLDGASTVLGTPQAIFRGESYTRSAIFAEDFIIDESELPGFVVPEPATLALMGLGIAGIGYRRHCSKIAAT